MSGNNSTPNNGWVRLNVGGKFFQTTKDTLSQHPESFLDRLVNSDLPSEKDETGAYLIDRDPEHFRTILNYLRSPVLDLDGDKKAMKELMCEADFYNIQRLVSEIRNIINTNNKKTTVTRTELIVIAASRMQTPTVGNKAAETFDVFEIVASETKKDYEVLKALRQKLLLEFSSDRKHFVRERSLRNWTIIEATLRSFGFVEEFRGNWDDEGQCDVMDQNKHI